MQSRRNVVPLKPTKPLNSDQKKDGALAAKLPPTPRDLGDIARKHWRTIGKQLENAGLISTIDLSIFRRYCETYELYVCAHNDVKERGEYQSTPNHYEQLSPWAVARDRHANSLQKMEDKLFLNPSARHKAKLGASQPVEPSEEL